MDFAKELAGISVEIEQKLKIEEKPVEQPKKVEEKIAHVKNVTILKGKYGKKVGYIKKDIPSMWTVLVPKRIYTKDSDFGSTSVKVGDVFTTNNIKYKIVGEFKELIKMNSSVGPIEVPSEEVKKLYLIEAKVQIKWSPEIETLYKNTLKTVPTYTRNLILGERVGDTYKIIKTKITEKELINSILKFEKMFGKKEEEMISLYISNLYKIEKKQAKKIVELYLKKQLKTLSVDDILSSKIEQIKQKYEYATLELDAKNEESIDNILNFELDKAYSFSVVKVVNYVFSKNNKNFGLFGETLGVSPKGKILEFEEEVYLGSKDVIIKNKDVMNITIRKGPYKGYKPKIIAFTPRKFVLEIEGKLVTSLSNREKGEVIKPITKNQFIYNDVIFENSSFGEVLEIDEDKSVKVKTVDEEIKTLKQNEYTSNGFYISSKKEEEEEQSGVELIFEEREQGEEVDVEETEETEQFEEQEEEAIEELMEEPEESEKLGAYKDVERVTFKRELSKTEEEFRKKLESLSNTLKIAVDNIYPLIDEVSTVFSKVSKMIKGKDLEEYFTETSSSMKYIYAIVLYRYLNTHGFKLYGVNSKQSYSEYLEKKEYFKVQDYRKNVWYDFSWYSSGNEKELKLTKENYSKIILRMMTNAEKFYTETISPINWKIVDPLKESRESAVALGYAGPTHMEVMTKEVRKGKDKDYELYVIGKIHDEEQQAEAKMNISDYFSMKEVSEYNKKNVMKEKGEVSRKETWEQIRKIQQTKSYILKKYADKLKKELETEQDQESRKIKSELVNNIKKLDVLIKESKDEKILKMAVELQGNIEEEIKRKIKQDEERKPQKRKIEEEEKEEEELSGELEEKVYDQEAKEKKFRKRFEESLVKKPRSIDIRTLLSTPKASGEDILKFFKTKAEPSNIKIFNTSKKMVEEIMDWNFS